MMWPRPGFDGHCPLNRSIGGHDSSYRAVLRLGGALSSTPVIILDSGSFSERHIPGRADSVLAWRVMRSQRPSPSGKRGIFIFRRGGMCRLSR